MRTRLLGMLAVGVAGALAMSACGGGSSGNTTPSGSATGSATGAAKGKVGVILPDSATSPRWENNDRPLLKSAFDAAGIESDIQNANKDVAKFGSICDSMINNKVNVLLIVNLDSDSGSACLKKAQAAGVQTIDYDRLTLGGNASFYVSFDNVKVGGLMAEGLTKCLTDAGKTSANIVYIDGDPTDNNAALFKQGYADGLKPAIDSGKYKLVGDQTGKWDENVAGTAFEQLYTQNGGKIDGVISANDTMAKGIIARLKPLKQNGKIPVTGQDASVDGLQAILAGDQCMTVYKPIAVEAKAASDLAIALIQGKDTASLATATVKDTKLNRDVPSVLGEPKAIYKDTVGTVISDGFQKKADVCTAALAAACTAAGIS